VLIIVSRHQPEGIDQALGAEVNGSALLHDEVVAADSLQKHLRLGRNVDF